MLQTRKLHHYLLEKIEKHTENRYEKMDEYHDHQYESTLSKVSEQLRWQNAEFHNLFCSLFIKDNDEFQKDIQRWIRRIADGEDLLSPPLSVLLKELFQIQSHYLQLIEEFVSIHQKNTSIEQLTVWNQRITSTISEIILEFTIQNTRAAKQKSDAEQALILEMSKPIILLTKETGLLSLTSVITAYPAEGIFEKAVNQCFDAKLEKLFIDLSRVPIIDTRVAQQLFQFIESLKIIGVKTVLAGINPVIAHTFIQSGFNFSKIEISKTLIQAIKKDTLSCL